MNNEYFFRIIIPNYNNEKYLESCLASVFSQTFKGYVLIIVDDKSTDNSADYLRNLRAATQCEDVQIYLRNDKVWNGGARNVGLSNNIKTQYTLFLDSDDTFVDENCLQHIYELIVSNNNPDCVRLSYNWCGAETRYVPLLQDSPASLVEVIDVACWTKCVKSELVCRFPENTLMEDIVQHIAQCDRIETVVPCAKPIVNWNRLNTNSCSTNAALQNHKWNSSAYRLCADLLDLECINDYCEIYKQKRLRQAKDELRDYYKGVE